MLNPKLQEALNRQINAELYSSYLYLSMAAWFESQTLPGMAGWMRIQAQEELMHAMKFYNFIPSETAGSPDGSRGTQDPMESRSKPSRTPNSTRRRSPD